MDDSIAPNIGHNSGIPAPIIAPIMVVDGLADQLGLNWAHKLLRRDDLLAGFERFCAATADGIASDEAQGRAGDFAKQIKSEVAVCEAIRQEVKRPVLDATRIIDGWWRGVVDPLSTAAREIERRMTLFAQEKIAASRRAAETERRQREEEAARLAAAAVADPALIERAIEAEQAVIEAPVAPVKAADASRVHGDLGSVSSLRGRWTYEIENEAAIPREYMMPNDRLIKAAIASGKRAIGGIRIFQDMKVSVR